MPATYQENFGLCHMCRPIHLCAMCGGKGNLYVPHETKFGHGHFEDCPACGVTRHEPTVRLRCLNCDKAHNEPTRTLTGKGVLNYFCNGECEDRYAARL